MTADREPTAAAISFEPVEPREGVAMVYGPDGKYLGCIGIERWRELVESEADDDDA